MNPDDKKIAIVCNPKAGNGKALHVADKISVLLKAKNINHWLFTASWPQLWTGISQIWIVGGDGTLNYFINQYPAIEIPLSIFKGGTGNDFQEMLYGRITVEQQIEQVVNGSIHHVDAGISNGKYFINGVGIGFDGAIVKDLLSKEKPKSRSSYVFSILKNIVGYKEKKCKLKFDEEKITQDCFMINIANGTSYGGGFKVAPKASIVDGKFDLNVVGKIAALKRFYYVPIIEKGKHLGLSFIQYHQTSNVKISSPSLLPAHVDGEYFEANEFVIECLPKRFSFLW